LRLLKRLLKIAVKNNFNSYTVKTIILIASILLSLTCSIIYADAETTYPGYWKLVNLSGKNLSLIEIISVARYNASITISSDALKRVEASNSLLKAAIVKDIPAYGLKKMLNFWTESVSITEITPGITEETSIEDPNIKSLISLSQSSGVPFTKEIVRAALLIRLNTILTGSTGASVELALIIRDFLNKKILPVNTDSTFISDKEIVNQAIIALALTGKGSVYYKGKKIASDVALRETGIKPIHFSAIDVNTMLETNSLAVAYAALIVHDISFLIDNAEIIYSMSMEGIGGGISALYETSISNTPYKGLIKSAIRINQQLSDSYLYNLPISKNADNIDLSYGILELGRARDILDLIEKNIEIRLNSPDANPIVQVISNPLQKEASLKSIHSIKTKNNIGLIYPSSNHYDIYWSGDIINLTTAIVGISSTSFKRIQVMQPNGFSQKTFDLVTQLNAETKRISETLLFNNYSYKDNSINMINTDFAVAYERLQLIIDKIYNVITMEAIFSAQKIDDKKKENTQEPLTFGKGTGAAFDALRTQIPYIEDENQIAKYFNKTFQFIKSAELKKALMKD